MSAADKRERSCAVCGTTFRPRLTQIRAGKGRFCSRKCLGVAFAGSGNPFAGRSHTAASKEKRLATMERNGSTTAGSRNGNWRGGRNRFAGGYMQVLVSRNVRELEHRHVMARHLGRPLLPTEIVHHKNGNKADNRIENLELTTRSEHMKHHHREILGARWPK